MDLIQGFTIPLIAWGLNIPIKVKKKVAFTKIWVHFIFLFLCSLMFMRMLFIDKLFGSNLVKEEKVQSEIKGWQKWIWVMSSQFVGTTESYCVLRRNLQSNWQQIFNLHLYYEFPTLPYAFLLCEFSSLQLLKICDDYILE